MLSGKTQKKLPLQIIDQGLYSYFESNNFMITTSYSVHLWKTPLCIENSKITEVYMNFLIFIKVLIVRARQNQLNEA